MCASTANWTDQGLTTPSAPSPRSSAPFQVPAPSAASGSHVFLQHATVHTAPHGVTDLSVDQVSRRKYELGKHFVFAVNASRDGSP